MITHNEIENFIFPYNIKKNGNAWRITVELDDDVEYFIKINIDTVYFMIKDPEKHNLENSYSIFKNNKQYVRLIYNVGYFIAMFVNELGLNYMKYSVPEDFSGTIAKLNNRAFMRYFNEPIITYNENDNFYLIKFKEE
jgi:hypothetical protein